MAFHVVNIVLAALVLVDLSVATACPPKAKVANGTYVGVHNSQYGQDFFLGVSYAKPPVNGLRFKAPEPLDEAFDGGYREATEYGLACIGYGSDTSNLDSPVSEDCLTLNIVRPSDVKPTDDLPVGVWVHGGSYVMGGSRDPRYNLSDIVKQSVKEGKPIIGVSINYRLSLWGFLFSKEMQAENAGNIAFKDQRMALQWLQDNIAAFGGSPNKVTIWGESAGARSLGMQLIAYEGQSGNLFHQASLESGSPVAIFHDASYWQPYFDALVDKTGCGNVTDHLHCLRELPWQTLSDIFSGQNKLSVPTPTLSAVLDGNFITAQATALLKQGKFAHVALLTGNNFDEGTAYAKQGINTDAEFAAWLKSLELNEDQIEHISQLYPSDPALGIPQAYKGEPPASFGSQFKRVAAVAGDYQQHAGRRLLVETYSSAGLAVYSYLWNVYVNGLPDPIYGATHFQEVAFVFYNTKGRGYATDPFATKPEAYVQLSDLMSKQWAAFMHDGVPSANGVEWPLYKPDTRTNIVFNANVTGLHYTAKDDYRTEQINYLLEKVFV
ncbi:carboxylesterase family protein [Sarocladium implicatum]|nr:carboxylesterase family protein [Sarocladium implicatum]